MSFTDEQYVNGVKKLTLIYKCEWINRMRVFLRYIDEHFTDNNFGYFPAMLEELRRIVDNGDALIAAAPEMYQMLQAILCIVEAYGSVTLRDNAANDIRGLLAKARGEVTNDKP